MGDKTYNGWTNYETWAVALWMDNEQESYRYWRDVARCHQTTAPTCRQVIEGYWTPAQAAVLNLADQLKEEMEDGTPVKEASIYADLLGAAMGEVDWQEIAASILDEIEPTEKADSGPVIFAYTRAQAIEDGVLVDVTETAKEAGMRFPTAVTAAVWQQYIAVPEGVEAQDEQGRLWDVMWMLRHAIVTDKRTETDRLDFKLMVSNDNNGPQEVTLSAHCGPGDQAEPVITVMLPHED